MKPITTETRLPTAAPFSISPCLYAGMTLKAYDKESQLYGTLRFGQTNY
jgi:hypothetical protein